MSKISSNAPDYILIAGLPRSGSTLMQLILSNNASVFTLPESHFFELSECNGLKENVKLDVANHLLGLVKKELSSEFDSDDILFRLSNDGHVNLEELFYAVIDEFRPESDRVTKRMIGIEKTPGHLAVIDRLLQSKNSIKVLLTIRNARDFTNSITQTYWSPSEFDQVIDLWNNSVKAITALQRKYPLRVKVAQYESLVANPGKIIAEASEFVGIEFDSSMLTNVNKNANKVVTYPEHDWKKNNLSEPAVVKLKKSIKLSYRQRVTVFYRTFFTALICNQIFYHRI